MADFVPPQFGKFGKSLKDLFKKKYSTNNTITIKNKTDFGLSVDTELNIKEKDINGTSTAKYKDKEVGEFEGTVATGSGKVYGTVKLTKLVPDATFSVAGGFDPTSKDCLVKNSWSVKASGDYRKNFVATEGSLLIGEVDNAVQARFEGTGALGTDGISVGGEIKVDLGETQKLSEYNVGSQYERDNFTATVKTEKSGDVIKASWLHKLSRDYTLGVEFVSDEFDRLVKEGAAPRRRILNVGVQGNLDMDTLFKVKANNYGEISTAVEHRLQNPSLLVNAAADFNAVGSSSFAAKKFGVGLTFGDF